MANTVHLFLSEYEKTGTKNLTIFINSGGGDVEAAFAIVNRIKESPIEITTHAVALVASAAFIVFLAGDKRKMAPSALLMYHQLSADLGDMPLHQLKKAVENLERDQRRIDQFIKSRTCVDFSKLDPKEDYYYNLDAASALGLTTRDKMSQRTKK